MTASNTEDKDQFALHIQYHGYPDSKVHGANIGPIWGPQDPSGPHIGPMNFAIWVQVEGASD